LSAPPKWIKPQLTRLVDEAPTGDGWLHEFKYDGYRMHARLDRGHIQLLTRTGLDWSHHYQGTIHALSALPVTTAYLDGELCAIRPDGVPAFSRLQAAMDEARTDELILFVFDLLDLDGESTAALPLIERKERLRGLFAARCPACASAIMSSAAARALAGTFASPLAGGRAAARGWCGDLGQTLSRPCTLH
jgi:ATP-dependent DNA ligase